MRRAERKELRRKEALERQAVRAKRSIQEQLDIIAGRFGASQREYDRLMKQLEKGRKR